MKAINNAQIPNEFYDPNAYLQPFEAVKRLRNAATVRGPPITSLHAAKVQLQKNQIEERVKQPLV